MWPPTTHPPCISRHMKLVLRRACATSLELTGEVPPEPEVTPAPAPAPPNRARVLPRPPPLRPMEEERFTGEMEPDMWV